MATVYSLVCWGGRTGKAVTTTIASPCVVTSTNHGIRHGAGLVFSTTGALPTGITAGTTYYARYVDANTFHLYDTAAHAIDTGSTTGRINTSGSQSGTHTAQSKLMLDYLASPPTSNRWGTSGSERCYDSLSAWVSGRASALAVDSEVCELGEAFTDIASAGVTLSLPSATIEVTASINGVRSPAWHGGNRPVSESALASGYNLRTLTSVSAIVLTLNKERTTVDGFSVAVTNYNNYYGIHLTGGLDTCKNCIVYDAGAKAAYGILVSSAFSSVINCIVSGQYSGIGLGEYLGGIYVANNLTTANNTGMYGWADCYATVYNNISVGNTSANWGTKPTNASLKASHNAGLSGQAWTSTGGVQLTIATTDFADYAGKNNRPASLTSPQVDTGLLHYGLPETDITDTYRPAYTGSLYGTSVTAGSFIIGLAYTIEAIGTTDFTTIGASANTIGVTFKATGVGAGTGTAILTAIVDVGPYEFDHGYGDWPAVINLTLDGVVAGSEVRIYRISDNTELAGVESCDSDPIFTFSANTTVRILVINISYMLIDFTYSATSGDVSIPIEMREDPWFKDPV